MNKKEYSMFKYPIYIDGDLLFNKKTKRVRNVGADTETHLYYKDEKLTEERASELLKENGVAWVRKNIEVKCWAFMFSDGNFTVVCQDIEDFLTALSFLGVKTVVWYNAKFDFAIFDNYILNNNWELASEEIQKKENYSHLHGKLYSSMVGEMGQRYKLTLWWDYVNKSGKTVTHKITMIDLLNIMAGGLERNLRSWDIKDEKGNPIRKLSMDYVNDDIEEAGNYLINDTKGLKLLADKVDETFKTLCNNLSLWKGDYLTAGGLSKKTFLRYMYGHEKMKYNIRDFRQDFFMSQPFDRYLRDNGLYRGGISRVNPYYVGKVVKGVYKFDENSMYPHKILTMDLPYGYSEYRKEIKEDDTIQIIHVTSMTGVVKDNCIGIWQDRLSNTFVDIINEKEPFLIFKCELDELHNWYFLDIEYDFVYAYKKGVNDGFRQFITDFYKIKSESKGTVREGAKLLLNSSYGKLSERVEREKGYHELTEDGYVHYVQNGVDIDIKGMLSVVIGSYITALARTDLMVKIRTICNGNVKRNFIYADTDSVHALTNNIETDDRELGMMKNEGEDGGMPYEYAIYLAPKTYLMKYKDKWVVHSKGVNCKEIEKLIKDMTFKEALTVFRVDNPIKSLTGINVRGGKALIYQEKYILRSERLHIKDSTDGDNIVFFEL